MHESHVVLIADEAAFARDLIARWPTERGLPGITVMSTDLLSGISENNFDLVIIGAVRSKRLASVLKMIDTGNYPIICILEKNEEIRTAKAEHPRLLIMQQHEAWLDCVMLLAAECLKRVDLTARLRRAEQAALSSARGATLGRYMLESRHDLNNSLTSVLGNAELLLLEVERLPEPARDQLQTIHEMALHMHQVMQRFSSVATEMHAEKTSQDETENLSHATGTGR